MCKIKTLSFNLYHCKSNKNAMPRGLVLVLGMCKNVKNVKKQTKRKTRGIVTCQKVIEPVK